MTGHATRLLTLDLEGPAGRIEALLNEREAGGHALAALVCHPHPLYGGTMHNKVVHRVASTLHEMGAAVLRFNFRGAGKSEGRHDQGRGELYDARAAFKFLRERHPEARMWVAGFSFGAWIAARLTHGEDSVERLVLIAPAVKRVDYSVMETIRIPKLIVQGRADTVCPPEDLETAFPRWAEPKQIAWVDGASHFFDRKLRPLHEALVEGLGAAATEGTSRDT